MDKWIVAAKETDHRVNESLASASKCAGSPVQINSIAIDLDCAMGETSKSTKHEHFSILGFAAEMRKKDRKVCLPFSSEGGDDVKLPPLPVPKFRWWQCSDCVPDIWEQKTTLGMVPYAAKSDAGTSSSHDAVERKDGDDHVSRNSKYGSYNYTCDKPIDFDPEGRKSITDARINEGVNSFPIITEANQVQITRNNNAGKNVSTRPYNPGNSISASDSDVPFSSLPPKRKPKLRSLADIIKEDKSLIPAQQVEEADSNPKAHSVASLDAPKGATKNLYRKRKIVLEEEEEDEEEDEESNHPVPTAKRSKGPVTESDNNHTTFRSSKISEVESERDNIGPVLLDSRLSAKPHQTKARKRRSLDTNRKTRQVDVDNRAVRPTVNLHKYPPVSAGTSFGGMGPFFNNSLFGRQMDSISNMSKDKRVEEGHYSSYTPPSINGSSGNCNNKIQEKIALDLSLSSYMGSGEMSSEKPESSGTHTEIPDLNESFVEKTSVTDGLQLPTLHKNSDMFASSGKEAYNNSTAEVEPGKVSDDIPMEIVELLAKNQRERALGNSRKHLGPDGTRSNNSVSVPSPYIEGTPCAFIPIGIYSNPSKNGDLDRGQFRQFGPLNPAGQHMMGLCSGPNIVPGPRPSESSDLLWAPRRKNSTFDVSQPIGSGDQRYNGKNIKRTVTDKSGGSMDAYTNDTIPAMQLLSLMDQRIVTGPSFKAGGSKNLLDRQFSPCNHHPRPVNKNGNPNDPFVGSSSFFGQQSNRTNGFPTLMNGVRCSGDFNSMSFFPQGNMAPPKGNARPIDLAGPSNISVQPRRRNPMLEVCTLNRNPADFSIPDAKNEFMISAKDLKPNKKSNLSKEKSRPGNLEGPKKRRMRYDPPRKEMMSSRN